jgi:hypothetical protein
VRERRIGTWSTRAACALLIAALAVPSRAETISYDPDRCATDANDQVFVRLQSGLAFAFPADDLWLLEGAPVEDPGPIADPTEPEGCPLNPFVTASAAVVYRPVGPPAPEEQDGARWRPELLRIHGHGGATRVQDVFLRLFDRCAEDPGNPIANVSPSLEECRMRRPNWAEEDWKSFVRAVPGAHPEFGGTRFVVYCDSPYHAGGGRRCQASYQLEDGLSLTYRFYDDVVPRENATVFDLQIRAFIAASRTPEYDALIDRR